MLTFRFRFAALAALTVILALGAFATRQESARAAGDLVILAGDGEDGYAVNAFLPAAVTITEGSSLTWDFAWFEPHTITFGTPPAGPAISTPSPATYDGSGFLTSDVTFGPGKTYTVTFPTRGTYPYNCLVHPFHRGTVNVVSETAPADSQAAVDARAVVEYANAVAELKSIAAEARAQPVESRTLADGSIERIVKIPRATQYGDVQQFIPPGIRVEVGDTITWRSAARSPHTVTFGPFPTGVPLPGNSLVDTIARPAAAYEGTGYWNSGVLGIDWPVGTEFTLKFAKPGLYDYYCILHIDQGHIGTVEVVAKAAPSPTPAASPIPTATTPAPSATPRPPATGTGTGGATEAGDAALVIVGVLVVGIALAGAAVGRR